MVSLFVVLLLLTLSGFLPFLPLLLLYPLISSVAPSAGPLFVCSLRICSCELGFPRDLHGEASKSDFLLDVSRIEELWRDPSRIRASNGATVQVLVPKIVPAPPPPIPVPAAPTPVSVPTLAPQLAGGDGGDVDLGGEDSAALSASAHTKRVALQKKAAATVVAAEDFARRFESGEAAVVSRDTNGDEQALSNTNTKVMCRMCFSGETDGSDRAKKMLSCRSCGKKYHRGCLKAWAQHRDLFHWSSWACPSCRTCEICRRTGDPNKFMFCKRCDGAYHCYCQHPPHKVIFCFLCLADCNSSMKLVMLCFFNGAECQLRTIFVLQTYKVPQLCIHCPWKWFKCEVMWFLGFTCCDACGRLFVKGNYCPVCLKVYRDSESTPMVCCDICQRWVHCHCDGISDEKYLQYQVDGNLQYVCATCRGECYQVKDLEDAVQELWRRRDVADHDLIVSLRAAAGLPTQEDTFSISPYSEDEDNGPITSKNEFGRSLKFSLKGVMDNSPKKSKDYGKKYFNRKSSKNKSSEVHLLSKIEADVDRYETQSYGQSSDERKHYGSHSYKNAGLVAHPSPVVGGLCHANATNSVGQPGDLKQKPIDEVMVNDGDKGARIVKIKSNKPPDRDSGDDSDKHDSKMKSVKTKKLVINLGARKINVTNSPKSDASSCQKEQDLPNSKGCEDAGNSKIGDSLMDKENGDAKPGNGGRVDQSGQVRILKFARRGSSLIKLGKVKGAPEGNPKLERDNGSHTSASSLGCASEVPTLKNDKAPQGKQSERPVTNTETNDDSGGTTASLSLPKDSKFSLKLKIKKPSLDNQSSQNPLPEEKATIRGQRSKRKRSSAFAEKAPLNEDKTVVQDSEMLEASWILKKLGNDAIGKRIEVHQPSESSWNKGAVSDVIEGTSKLSVTLDDGRVLSVELGKQAVRFVPQKQKR
ncbi:unnamed protein product [Linum tenue]|uniref:Uncharacterized protein n=1 Tax=Linum tenue TaxID=586396 RepID=A0AAV0J439_9ROSI|nr:unnamed protein product [Linum tenue]